MGDDDYVEQMEQGWYWLPRSLRVALWTRYRALTPSVDVNHFAQLMKQAEAGTQSAASILKFPPQYVIKEVAVYNGFPAAIATAQLLARPEHMEGLEEGKP